MLRPQFSLRVLLLVMFCAACFFAGVRFERVRRSERGRDALKQLMGGSGGLSPPNYSSRPEWEKKAIGLAKSHLETIDGNPVDATFTPKQEANGYSVWVQYITGRDNYGQPIYIPGGHCTVLISDDWEVTRVLPGA